MTRINEDNKKTPKEAIYMKISAQHVTKKIHLTYEIEKLKASFNYNRNILMSEMSKFILVMPKMYIDIIFKFYNVSNKANNTFKFIHYERKHRIDSYIIAIMIQRGIKFFLEAKNK